MSRVAADHCQTESHDGYSRHRDQSKPLRFFTPAVVSDPTSASSTMEKDMIKRMNFEAARTLKARALISALLGCLGWLPFSSVAEAAPFQQYRNGVCASNSICTIDFGLVPAGGRLDITNVSCYLRTSGTVELSAVQILVVRGMVTQSALTIVPEFVDTLGVPFESVFSANHPIFAFATAGQRFRAFAELKKGTFSQFACHISGQLQSST